MISNCGGGSFQLYGLDEQLFFADVAGLMMIFVLPAAIVYALWRIFVTNRTAPGGTTILGLDENLVTYTKVYGISGRTLFLYWLTAVVFAFEALRSLVDLL